MRENNINKIETYKGYIYIVLDMKVGWEEWRNGYVKLQDNSKFKDFRL